MQTYHYLIDSDSKEINFDSKNLLENSYDLTCKFNVQNKYQYNISNDIVGCKQKWKILLFGKGEVVINDYQKEYILFTSAIKEKSDASKKLLNYMFDNIYPESNAMANNIEGGGIYCIPLIKCNITNYKKEKSRWSLELIGTKYKDE